VTSGPATDLRQALARLEERGGLSRIKREVDPGGELTAVLDRMEMENIWTAALFENLAGHDGWAVAASLFSDRSNVAALFDSDQGRLIADLSSRLDHPIEPENVDEGPVQETVLTGAQASLDALPLVLHHERDAGRYVSLGLTFVNDPDTGRRNVGVYRYMKRDERTMVPSLTALSNIADIFRRHEERGLPMEVAVVPGVSPSLIVAASYRAALGVDECALAGGLQREAVRLVPGKTVDLSVPADAEVVIEGRIMPGDRYPEAPFADMSRSYSRVKQGPLMEVTGITHRGNPIMQLAFSGHADATNMAAVGQEVAMWRAVSAISSNVVAVHVPPSGFGFHCYLAVKKVPTVEGRERGEQGNVMLAALGAVPQLKLVVAFDEDVNIFDDRAVLGALARRFQAKDPESGRDRILVIPNMMGATYDPSSFHREFPNSKMIIDATIRSDVSEEVRASFEEARPPWPHEIDLGLYLSSGPGANP